MSSAAGQRTRLVRFESQDRLLLSGLLYEPRSRRARSLVIWLHGNGDSSVFTSARTQVLGEVLSSSGIAFLPFDNRGSHMLKTFRRRTRGGRERVEIGMARELIRDAVHDIRGAVRFARGLGYSRIHLAGHSTGANKICVYHSKTRKREVSSNILVAGGDDAGLYREELGRKRYGSVLERARRAVAAGRGEKLIPAGISPFPLSWSSLLDTIDPEGDYNVFPFREGLTGESWSRGPLFAPLRRLREPTLAIYGSEDEFCFGDVPGCVRLLEQHAPREGFETAILEGADHGFSGQADRLGEAMVSWARRVERRKGRESG